ncbi:hypothetical protein HRbin27_00648 [bacterium HR27]|nr:hypothetical protein HRbin27_00648 [bacterium HR27]
MVTTEHERHGSAVEYGTDSRARALEIPDRVTGDERDVTSIGEHQVAPGEEIAIEVDVEVAVVGLEGAGSLPDRRWCLRRR